MEVARVSCNFQFKSSLWPPAPKTPRAPRVGSCSGYIHSESRLCNVYCIWNLLPNRSRHLGIARSDIVNLQLAACPYMALTWCTPNVPRMYPKMYPNRLRFSFSSEIPQFCLKIDKNLIKIVRNWPKLTQNGSKWDKISNMSHIFVEYRWCTPFSINFSIKSQSIWGTIDGVHHQKNWDTILKNTQ